MHDSEFDKNCHNGPQDGSSVLNAMSFARLLGNIFKWINKRLIICMLELAKMYSQATRKIKSNENVKVLSYLLMLQSLCSCYTLSRIIPRTGEYHGDK